MSKLSYMHQQVAVFDVEQVKVAVVLLFSFFGSLEESERLPEPAEY